MIEPNKVEFPVQLMKEYRTAVYVDDDELAGALENIWPIAAQDNLARNVLLHLERAVMEVREAVESGNPTRWYRIAERLQRDLGHYVELGRGLDEDDWSRR